MKLESKLNDLVEKISSKYAARCWWADIDDLRQEAWVAALEARNRFSLWRGYQSSKGKKDSAEDVINGILLKYAWIAVSRTLANFLWKESSPVTGPKNRGNALRGIHRASLDAAPELAGGSPDGVSFEQWWAQFDDQAVKAVKESDEDGLAELVLLHGYTLKKVAEVRNVPVKGVKEATERARERLRTDPVLREIVASL